MAPGRPLLVTADEALLDDLLRLSAAAGITASVAPDVSAARPDWAAAPLVVVGGDLLSECSMAGFARRSDVVVVHRAEPAAVDWRALVAVGAESLLVLPGAETELVHRMGDAAEGRPGAGLVVCCVGGRGGAGASVLSCALAVTAASAGRRVLLADLDPVGGGLDLVLGIEGATGLRWPDLDAARGRVSARSMHDALPCTAGVSVLSAIRPDGQADDPDGDPIPADVARAVVTAAAASGDIVIADLPRQLTPAALVLLAVAQQSLVVVPAEVRATAAAARVVASARPHTSRMAVVVRAPGPARLPPVRVAEVLGLPLAAVIPSTPRLAVRIERGEFTVGRRSALRAACRDVLGDVVMRRGAGRTTGSGHRRVPTSRHGRGRDAVGGTA
ncbi:MAG: septum site-determining protein Ssd [Mycobacteriales bacterium]